MIAHLYEIPPIEQVLKSKFNNLFKHDAWVSEALIAVGKCNIDQATLIVKLLETLKRKEWDGAAVKKAVNWAREWAVDGKG